MTNHIAALRAGCAVLALNVGLLAAPAAFAQDQAAAAAAAAEEPTPQDLARVLERDDIVLNRWGDSFWWFDMIQPVCW